MRMTAMAAIFGLLAAAPAAGLAAPAKKGPGYDPNREICKSRPVIGTRLKRVRECHTAQQWEEQELQERLGLMRKQINGDPGCSGSSSQSCNPIATGGRDTPW